MDWATALAPHGAGSASQCSKVPVPADLTRGQGPTRARPDHLCAAERVSGASVFRYTGRLSVPSCRSGDSHSTTWCRVGFSMLKSPRAGRPDASRAFHGALDDRFGASPRALIGPRFACLRPARASLSLGKLPPYHTMRGCSLDPRAEPMSRHHDRYAPHDRRAEMERCLLRFREIRTSSVNYRAEDPVHSKI